MPNYKNLEINQDNFSLKSINLNYIKDILNSIHGSVKEYFIDFKNEEEVERWIDENIDLMEKQDKVELVILREDQFVGMISVRNLKSEPIFGLWIKPEFQKQGVAKKSMKMLKDWMFNNTELNKIYYTAETKNLASINLAKSLNATYTRDFIDEDGAESSEFIFFKN